MVIKGKRTMNPYTSPNRSSVVPYKYRYKEKNKSFFQVNNNSS